MFERKLDGVRAVAVRDGAGAELYSRNRQPMGRTYPELREALEQQLPPGVVADGEIVAFDGAQTSFTRLQGRIGITDPDRARATGIAVHGRPGSASVRLARWPRRHARARGGRRASAMSCSSDGFDSS